MPLVSVWQSGLGGPIGMNRFAKDWRALNLWRVMSLRSENCGPSMKFGSFAADHGCNGGTELICAADGHGRTENIFPIAEMATSLVHWAGNSSDLAAGSGGSARVAEAA